MKITFLGAAKCVTGSSYLVEIKDVRFLVDCGMFQGTKELRERNYSDFAFNPAELDFVVLTHAHIDHSGLIPKLFNQGFKGYVMATSATVELCEVMLPDSGHIQEMECERKNRKRSRRGQELIEPIYTAGDASNCLTYFKRADYNSKIEIKDFLKICFRNSGHILGSACLEIYFTENGKEQKIIFTGDVGNKDQPIVKDPYEFDEADYLVVESTYGNRVHKIREPEAKREQLKEAILRGLEKGGNIIVPAFAIERTQDLLVDLNYLMTKGSIPKFPIYLDSPLAIAATEIFQRHHQYFDDATKQLNQDGKKAIIFENLKFSRTAKDSQSLNDLKEQAMIISASGMCDAGRIKHHLKHNLWREEATVFIVGYQADGTLGRRLVNGEKIVRIHGESVMVNAEIVNLEGFSGHIDNPGMIKWLSSIKIPPVQTFIIHGEEEQQVGLKSALEENLNFKCHIPDLFEQVVLTSDEKVEINVEKVESLKLDYKDKYFETYRTIKQNLKELIKLRLNSEEVDELYEDLETLEKISRRFLAIKR